MGVITLALFLICTWGLGFTFTKFLKNSDDFLERNLIRIGIGLGIIPFIGAFISFLHVPLDWRILLLISLIIPLSEIRKLKIPKPTLRLKKSYISTALVILVFLGSFYVYFSGAFNYPWLENDDPWFHAESIKYIAVEKDIFPPISFMYLNPYPPGYAIVMGVLHQTTTSLYWTMKFFNALICALGIIFFYFFTKKFTDNRNKALFATFVFAIIPCYLSHFIWAHSLVITLLLPALYCIEMVKEDKKWIIPSILVVTSICLTQPTQPIKFAVMFGIYFIVKWLSTKKFNISLLCSLFMGYIISLFWWYNHWRGMLSSGIGEKSVTTLSQSISLIDKLWLLIQRAFPYDGGTATRVYSFSEIVFAKNHNMINNPIGIGVFITLLIILSIIPLVINFRKLLDKKYTYLTITFLWAIFAFLGINSMTFNLPVGFFGFRFWMLFAIPASILAAEGFWFLSRAVSNSVLTYVGFLSVSEVLFISYKILTESWNNNLGQIAFPNLNWLLTLFLIPLLGVIPFALQLLRSKSFHKKSLILTMGVLFVIISLVSVTSLVPKFKANTATWPFGIGWTSPDEVLSYVWMRENLEPDSKVFTFTDNFFVFGNDMYSCEWCEETINFHKTAFNESPSNLHAWLKSQNYEYLVIGGREMRGFGMDETNNKINELASSGLFSVIHNSKGALILSVLR